MHVLDERHSLGDGVTVELRYYGDRLVRIYIADPLGDDEVTVPSDASALDWFHHPYALAFPGRNPWESRTIYADTDASDESWLNTDETASAAA